MLWDGWRKDVSNTDKRMLRWLNIDAGGLNKRIEHVLAGFTNEEPLRPFRGAESVEWNQLKPDYGGLRSEWKVQIRRMYRALPGESWLGCRG